MIFQVSAEEQTPVGGVFELSDFFAFQDRLVGQEVVVFGRLDSICTGYSARTIFGFFGPCDYFSRLVLSDGNGRVLSCPSSKKEDIDPDLIGSHVTVTGVYVRQSVGDWVMGNSPLGRFYTSAEHRTFLRITKVEFPSVD